jgi:hypothetical protein
MKANIDAKEISELRSLNTPPRRLCEVMIAVCILLDKDPSWKECRKLFTNPRKFKQMLDQYDTSKVTPLMKNKIKEYVENHDFNAESLKQVSIVASALFEWVLEVNSVC